MFFTQDDYKKIQQWLIKNSVKDTEFNEANIPFKGNEIITIVQGNQNKKVFLKDLVAQIFNLGVSDFINVSEKYDAYIIDLEEAVRLIPSRARKKGQVITFLNKENLWQIYQFKGALNQWNILDQWENVIAVIDSILPDEEDLTKSEPDANGNSYLSLKDREYNPEDFSGLGRVILRKNIVEIEDSIYGKVKKNVLYQEMFTQSNTIYEIRYDFDLNGQEITIPEGCVLDFQGGCFKSGTINLNYTKIKEQHNVFVNCILQGVCDNNQIYSNWFYDEGKQIASNLTNIVKDYGTIVVDSDLLFIPNKSGDYLFKLNSNTSLVIQKSITINNNDFSDVYCIYLKDCNNINISGPGHIIGDSYYHTVGENGHGVYIRQAGNICIDNLTIKNCSGDGISIWNRNSDAESSDGEYLSVYVNNVKLDDNRRNNLSILGGTFFGNNIISENAGKTNGTLPKAGIDIEPVTIDRDIVHVNITNSVFKDSAGNHDFNLDDYSNRSSINISNSELNKCQFVYLNNVCLINNNITPIYMPSSQELYNKFIYIGNKVNSNKPLGIVNFNSNQINDLNFYNKANCINKELNHIISSNKYGRIRLPINFDGFIKIIASVSINDASYNCEYLFKIKKGNSSTISQTNKPQILHNSNKVLLCSEVRETSDYFYILFYPYNCNISNDYQLSVIVSCFTIDSINYSDVLFTTTDVISNYSYIYNHSNDLFTYNLADSPVVKDNSIFRDASVSYANSLKVKLGGDIYKIQIYNTSINKGGTTSNRPQLTAVDVGYMYFDTDLGKPIYKKNNLTWVDATGADV